MKKRIWSFLLVLCMVLTLLPAAALAADAPEVSFAQKAANERTVTAAVADAAGADSVKLTAVMSSGDKATETAVVEQKLDESSLYTYYKKLLMIRRANPEIAHGTYTALKSDGTKLGGFEATYNGSTVLVLHNTAWESKTIDLSTRTDRVPSALRAVIGAEDATLSGTTLTIGAQTSVVIACK